MEPEDPIRFLPLRPFRALTLFKPSRAPHPFCHSPPLPSERAADHLFSARRATSGGLAARDLPARVASSLSTVTDLVHLRPLDARGTRRLVDPSAATFFARCLAVARCR